MTIEEFVFDRHVPDVRRMLAFGFMEGPDGWRYSRDFMDGEFRAEVLISREMKPGGRVIETDTGEEYVAVHVPSYTGAFVGEVREQYMKVLEEIAEAVCTAMPFSGAQANRLAAQIRDRWGHECDRPFEDKESGAVFRAPGNDRWYALVMRVPRSKLRTAAEIERDEAEKAAEKKARMEAKARGEKLPRRKKAPAEEDPELVEIVNVKIRPERREELLGRPGLYPAWHMNHARWITAVLDDTIPDEEVMSLIADSLSLVEGRSGKAGKEIHAWLIPANPAYYDVDAGFEAEDILFWKQSSSVHVGDEIYMYVGQPVAAIRYKCEAVEVDIPSHLASEHVKLETLMRIRLLAKLDREVFTWEALSLYGIRAVRGPRSIPEKLKRDIDAFIEKQDRKGR